MKKEEIELIFSKIKLHYKLKNNTELAQLLDVSPAAIANSISRNKINWDNIITKCEDLSIDELLGRSFNISKNEHPMLVTNDGIPLVTIDQVCDGQHQDSYQMYNIPAFQYLNVDFIIRMSGHSMAPTYRNEDLLACRRIHELKFFQWGKVHVMQTSQGPLVKRVFEDDDPNMIQLASDNYESYPPFSIPKSDIRCTSIIVGLIRIE